MNQETLTIHEHTSKLTTVGQLIISAQRTSSNSADLAIGRVGYPNIERSLKTGGAVLFETQDDGIFEVRALTTSTYEVTLLVSRVSPSRGVAGGLADDDANNRPFEPSEIARIKESLAQVRNAISNRPDLRPEQIDLISRKLDEMQRAAERLGRKDWMNWAVGMLTSIIVTAALGSEAGKFLFQATGSALSWLFGEALKLIP